jgi:sugar O-acyltransferase (sialic acid O-acetyltransferase NeuD family)
VAADRATDAVPPRDLLIFPCNGNGLEALDCLGHAYRFVGFVDDDVDKQGSDALGHRVMGRAALSQLRHARVLAVPGSPQSFRSRREVIDGLRIEPVRFATVVHPSARVSPLAALGRNVLLMAGVVITSDAVIGDHVCVLPNTVIHHGARIGPWSLLGANVTIAGSVRIGENCYVGSGSTLINHVQIGNRAMVGLGSNVIRDVAPGATVAGNPARVLS